MGAADLNVMLRVDGKSFRCSCKCNVFQKLSANRYSCNACESIYESD